jgi:hypothetical protein
MQDSLNEIVMRPEEEMAKNAICEWVTVNHRRPPLKITPEPFGQDTAPDYLLDFGTEKVFMEVTLSDMGFLLNPRDTKFEDPNPLENGHDRIQYESSAIDFLVKQYDSEVKNGNGWLCKGESLIIFVLSPIPLEGRGKLGTKLLKVLKQLYLKDNILNYTDDREPNEGDFTFLTGKKELPGLTIHVLKTMFYKDSSTYSPIMVNFFATQSSNNQPYDCLLDNQSWYVLESIIKKKSQKCEQLQEEVWLAIINQHHILDMADYQRGTAFIEDALKNSMFTKIFIVDAGKAHELYHKTS